MKYKVMSRAGKGAWTVRHFETEAAARAYANQCYQEYADTIELYCWTRSGYKLIAAHREHWKKAVERWVEDGVKDAPCFR